MGCNPNTAALSDTEVAPRVGVRERDPAGSGGFGVGTGREGAPYPSIIHHLTFSPIRLPASLADSVTPALETSQAEAPPSSPDYEESTASIAAI